MWIVGAGGFGRDTLDAALACGIEVNGFLDDKEAGSTVRGQPVLAPDAPSNPAAFVVAVADPAVRAVLVERMVSAGHEPLSIVDPRAVVGPETVIGPGAVILATAFISSGVEIGAHVQVCYGASIGHDSRVAPCVTVLPGATIGGAVVLDTGVLVGANSTVLPGLTAGAGATIGAGAVVTCDVASGVTVVGVPARPLRSQ